MLGTYGHQIELSNIYRSNRVCTCIYVEKLHIVHRKTALNQILELLAERQRDLTENRMDDDLGKLAGWLPAGTCWSSRGMRRGRGRCWRRHQPPRARRGAGGRRPRVGRACGGSPWTSAGALAQLHGGAAAGGEGRVV